MTLDIPPFRRVKTIPPNVEVVLTSPRGNGLFTVATFISGKPQRVSFWKRENEAQAAYDAEKARYGATDGDD